MESSDQGSESSDQGSERSDQGSESSDQGSESSDQDSDVPQWGAFVVVRTFETHRDRYDCIPSSWLDYGSKSDRTMLNTVYYRFPPQVKVGKGAKFRKNQKAKKTWPLYMGKVVYDTDSRAVAFGYIEWCNEKTRRICEEEGFSNTSTSELDSEEDIGPKEQNKKNKKTQGTKRNIVGMKSSDQDSDQWKDFVVVRRLETISERYDCMPSSWLVFESESNLTIPKTVKYRFPPRKGIIFRKNQKPKKSWRIYKGKVVLKTDSRAELFRRLKEYNKKTRICEEEIYNATTTELDSDEDSGSKERNKKNKKKQGTKRKQSEQENKNVKAKSTKIADESEQKLESEKIEIAKQLHSQCNNFYEDFNATYQKSLSILDKTAAYLQKIMSAHKAKLPTSINANKSATK